MSRAGLTVVVGLVCVLVLGACSGGGGVPPEPEQPRVTSPAFTTGAGPNDMLAGTGSLFIACSLDNVVREYGYTGSQLAQAAFDVGASPSYLGAAAGALWVVANGDNTVVSLAADTQPATLAPRINPAVQLSGAAAFIGPSQPAAAGDWVFVPRNEISGFAPTVYGTGLVTWINTAPTPPTSGEWETVGRNPQFAAVDASRDLLYVACTGEVQFNASFQPHLESDSTLDVFDLEQSGARIASINLGRIGVGRIALSANGALAYLGNSLTGNVYKVDLAARTVLRGAADPIALTAEYTYISDVAYTPDGKYLLATSFNTDELYVLDCATDQLAAEPLGGPFAVSPAAGVLAGAANVEVVPAVAQAGAGYRYSAFVLLGVANAVARVDLP